MSKKTAGYIIVDESRFPLTLCNSGGTNLSIPKNIEKRLVISFGNATMFPDLRSAKKAKKDTESIAVANGLTLDWHVKDWRIVRLTLSPR